MKRTLLVIIVLFFPWLAFLLEGRAVSALTALALQLTFVGWLPASIWAWSATKSSSKNTKTASEAPPPTKPSEPGNLSS